MQLRARTVTKLAATLAVGAVMTAAAVAVAKPPFGGGCLPGVYCLDVWRPVICSNGQIYSNDCYAAKACATGCVPYYDVD